MDANRSSSEEAPGGQGRRIAVILEVNRALSE